MKNDCLRLIGAASLVVALAIAPLSAEAAWWNSRPGAASANAVPQREAPVILAQGSQGDAERFNRIEAQMRTLTGQVEELTFQLRQLQDQLKRMHEDNEFRFRELEGGASPPPPRSEAPSASGPAETATLRPSDAGQADAIGAIVDQEPPLLNAPDLGGPGAPPQSLGTLTMDAPVFPDQPMDLTVPLAPPGVAGGAEVASIAPSGDPRTDYESAYSSILNGDYDRAEVAFRQFLSVYPGDALAPDAQYWLGESLFVRALYRDAANEFLAGYKAYPKSGKAPDALLKLGLSLAGLGERDAACSTFAAVLKQYPDASNALRQRVKVEQASASC